MDHPIPPLTCYERPRAQRGSTETRLREHTEDRRDDTAIDQVAALTRRVLDYMSDAGLDLPICLDAVFWGIDRLATDGKTKYQRSAFLRSAQFPRILEGWEEKSSAAKVVLKAHALSTIKVAVNAEMDDAGSELTITSDEIHEENLLSITQEFRSSGMAQGSVFPEPVLATTVVSRPRGMMSICTNNGK